jgi:D-arginine dehydrogenase
MKPRAGLRTGRASFVILQVIAETDTLTRMNSEVVDVVVVGGGIAGTSVAALLAETLQVAVLERESHPGLHSTGRSAALFSEIYGGTTIRALSRGSREFFYSPPPEFAAAPLVKPRGTLQIATAEQLPRLEEFANLPDIAAAVYWLDASAVREACPILRPGHIVAGVMETASADMDVNAIHQGFLRQLRANGGQLWVNSEVNTLEHTGAHWKATTGNRVLQADVVINAAGAWADVIARQAGVREVGLQPRRRTALIIDAPKGMSIDDWPSVIDIDEQFYFKPDAGALLVSPADETPSEPCDAWPDDMDVAIAVDRVQNATTLEVERVRRSWAGLRSFVTDRTPVVGYAADAPGFFWLAAQGGYGIQTSPAMARLAAALVRRRDVPAELLDFGLDVATLRPERLVSL